MKRFILAAIDTSSLDSRNNGILPGLAGTISCSGPCLLMRITWPFIMADQNACRWRSFYLMLSTTASEITCCSHCSFSSIYTYTYTNYRLVFQGRDYVFFHQSWHMLMEAWHWLDALGTVIMFDHSCLPYALYGTLLMLLSSLLGRTFCW